jgi:hypothetical protein
LRPLLEHPSAHEETLGSDRRQFEVLTVSRTAKPLISGPQSGEPDASQEDRQQWEQSATLH